MVKRILSVVIITLLAVAVAAADDATVMADSVETVTARADSLTAPVRSDSVASPRKVPATLWIKQLFQNGFHINDPGVDYPRFPRFLLGVYNWGDRLFNHYDTAYVVSTGKNWKLLGKSYNWNENYALIFPKNNLVHISGDIYADVGGYLSFMAVSVGYMFNANEFIGNTKNSRSTFNLNFTCSRFNVDYTRTSTQGDAHIRRFGKYKGDERKSIHFEGVHNTTTSAMATYFFNHTRYSHAAAYCFSKYQLKSAGSWMAGFTYIQQRIDLDFTTLPPEMLESLPDIDPVYSFNYRDYTLSGGYGYNWAIRPRKWLINAYGTLGVGYQQALQGNTSTERGMPAANIVASFSVVYNHRALFVSARGHFTGNFFFDKKYTFFNSLNYMMFVVGMRF